MQAAARRFVMMKTPAAEEMRRVLENRDMPSIMGLVKRGADINATDGFDNTPLILAVIMNETEAAQTLIDKGADLEKMNRGGNTALMMSIMNGRVEMLRLLLDGGADSVSGNMYGVSPLAFAQRKHGDHDQEIIRVLQEAPENR